jgi:hypothetical protein
MRHAQCRVRELEPASKKNASDSKCIQNVIQISIKGAMKATPEIQSGAVKDTIMEEGNASTQPQEDGDEGGLLKLMEPEKPGLNNYVLACALLASLSSALLGYGKLVSLWRFCYTEASASSSSKLDLPCFDPSIILAAESA